MSLYFYFNFAFLLQSIQNRNTSFFFMSQFMESICHSVRFTLSGAWGYGRTLAPVVHGLRLLCHEARQPASLAVLPTPSAVSCHFSLLLICSLMNTQLLRSRSKNVSLSVPTSSKVQICLQSPFPLTSKLSSGCQVVGIPGNRILENQGIIDMPACLLIKQKYDTEVIRLIYKLLFP